MNTPADLHAPTPEFRASLEQEIVRTLRRETQFAPSMRTRHRGRIRTVVTLAIGLLLGVGTQFASAQVQNARSRSELESVTTLERNVALLRFTAAQTDHEQAQRNFDVGMISQQTLLASKAALLARQAQVFRIDLELAEIRATSAAPRDELWAPLVNGRDFVRERLAVLAVAAQQQLAAAEAGMAESERAFRVGAAARQVLTEAQAAAAQAKHELQVVTQKLMLREQFLKERLAAEEITRRLQRFELLSEIDLVQQRLQLATARVELAREYRQAGMTTELEVKRAEVEVLERTLELERLRVQLRTLETGER